MSCSTHAGLSEPPTCSDSGREFVAAPAEPDFQSRAVGVAQATPTAVASPSPLDALAPARFQFPATVGVGHILTAALSGTLASALFPAPGPRRSELRGVGHGEQEQPLSPVRGAHVGGPDARGTNLVTEASEPPRNHVQPPPLESCDIFDNNRARVEFADDSQVLEPESRPLPGESGPGTRDGDVLAGEPAADDVDGLENGSAN